MSSSASPSMVATTNVMVGGSADVFVHPSVPVNVSDTVTFRFMAGNHSVVQSSFEKPCEPLEGGFNSGFMPATDGDGYNAYSPIMFVVTITSPDPIYYYCSQYGHCQSGMVGTINAPYNDAGSYLNFSSAALAATTAIIPASVGGGVFVNTATTPPWTSTAPAGDSSPTGSSGSAAVTAPASGSQTTATAAAAGGSTATASGSAAAATTSTSGTARAHSRHVQPSVNGGVWGLLQWCRPLVGAGLVFLLLNSA